MKIAIAGGGPGGLYFATLMTSLDPSHDITVWERNAPDDTFGFGVVFSDETLGSIEGADRVVHERMEKPLLRLGAPDARNLRAGREALRSHLAMLEDLLASRDALSGRRIGQADFVAAAHLSVLDYFGEVPWANWPGLKTWYMKLKSRPGFRPLLTDRFPGVSASTWYADLDF